MLFRSTVLLAALLALVPSSIARYNYDDDQGKGKGGKKDKAKKMGKKESKGKGYYYKDDDEDECDEHKPVVCPPVPAPPVCPDPMVHVMEVTEGAMVDIEISSLTTDDEDSDGEDISVDAGNTLAVDYLVNFADFAPRDDKTFASANLRMFAEDVDPDEPVDLDIELYQLLGPYSSTDRLIDQLTQLLDVVNRVGPIFTIGQPDSDDPTPFAPKEFINMNVTGTVQSYIDGTSPVYGFFVFADAFTRETLLIHGATTGNSSLAPCLMVTYTDGTTDAYLPSAEALVSQVQPFDDLPEEPLMRIGTIIDFETQGLLWFEGAVVPSSAASDSIAATLDLWVTSDSGTVVTGHRMLVEWDATSTWSSFSENGPVAGIDYEADPSFTLPTDIAIGDKVTTDVSADVAYWTSNPSSNYGWILINEGGDGFDFSSFDGDKMTAPRLTIAHVA